MTKQFLEMNTDNIYILLVCYLLLGLKGLIASHIDNGLECIIYVIGINFLKKIICNIFRLFEWFMVYGSRLLSHGYKYNIIQDWPASSSKGSLRTKQASSGKWPPTFSLQALGI